MSPFSAETGERAAILFIQASYYVQSGARDCF